MDEAQVSSIPQAIFVITEKMIVTSDGHGFDFYLFSKTQCFSFLGYFEVSSLLAVELWKPVHYPMGNGVVGRQFETKMARS